MLIDKLHHRYMASEDDNGGSNGGDQIPEKTDVESNSSTNVPKLSEKEAELLKEVMSKKKTIGELQTTVTKLQEDLKRFDGIDPESVRKMLAEQKAKADLELERKGEFDRLKAQMIEAHQKEIENLQEALQSVRDQLVKAMSQNADLTVGNAFSNSIFIKDETVLTPAKTRKLYGDYFAFEDGKVVGYDKPAGATERTVLVDGVGNPLSFDEALRKVIEADPEKDTILKSKAKRGAGSGTLPNTKPYNPPKKLSSIEKIELGLRKQMQSKS